MKEQKFKEGVIYKISNDTVEEKHGAVGVVKNQGGQFAKLAMYSCQHGWIQENGVKLSPDEVVYVISHQLAKKQPWQKGIMKNSSRKFGWEAVTFFPFYGWYREEEISKWRKTSPRTAP